MVKINFSLGKRLLIFGTLAIAVLFFLINWFSVSGHKVLSRTTSELKTPQIEAEMIPQPLSTPETTEYSAMTYKGDSAPRLFRIIINKFMKDNNLNLAETEVNSLVNKLIQQTPMNLKPGDIVVVSKQDLQKLIVIK